MSTFAAVIQLVVSMRKEGSVPTVCWLKVTDYMLGWVEHELGGTMTVSGHRVISVQHLDGAGDVLQMETTEQVTADGHVGKAMSCTWRNAIMAGLALDAGAMEREYGVSRESLKLYVPIECPATCITEGGILRSWNIDTCFSRRQANELLQLLREAFWKAVGDFAGAYAKEHEGEKYAQVEMIEAFCQETRTNDIYVEAMRREWQRRRKRAIDLLAE